MAIFRREHLASIVFSFTHNALPYVHLLLIQVTVDVPLDLCVAAILHPWQLFTGDGAARLVVEGSAVQCV